MKNRWLLNVALAMLVGALVLLAIYKPAAKQGPVGTPLTSLAAQDIQRIQLMRPKQSQIVLEKNAEGWRLTTPLVARANEARVSELIQLATTRVPTRFPTAPAELGKFALDSPLATLFLNEAEIRFGGMHPLENQLYVWHNNHVQLIPVTALRAASAPLNDFLNAGLLEDKTKPLAFRFSTFSLQQNEQGAWMRTPVLTELASDAINRFVDEWRYARALAVAPYSGKPIKERVTITVANGDKTRTLELGVLARAPEFIVYRPDENLQYHFSADIGTRLMQIRPE